MNETTKYLLECYYGERRLTADAQSNTFLSWISSICAPFLGERTGVLRAVKVTRLYPDAPDLLHRFENEEPSVDARQIQEIRAIVPNLRAEADQVEIRILNRRALRREGLNHEERQVVRRISRERAPITLSTLAGHLRECLTHRTFRRALSLLSSNISNEFNQLAAACELVRLLYPTVRQAIQTGRIYGELEEFITDRLDEVL